MQNKLQIIKQQEVLGKDFKVYGDWDNPLFLAKDVAEWIENTNTTQMLRSIDEDEKALYTMYRVDGSTNKSWFLTEYGLYEVLMQSRKPIAKAFKKEVKQILKSIRKHGGYIKDELLESRETANRYFEMLKHEEEITKASEDLIDILEQTLDITLPKAKYCDMVLDSHNAIPVSVIAKDYGYTAAKFNKLLHECRIQYKIGSTWLLYSKYQNCGYTETTTYEVEDKIVSVSTRWTQKGRRFIYNTLKKYGIIPEFERKHEIGQLFLGGECDWYE